MVKITIDDRAIFETDELEQKQRLRKVARRAYYCDNGTD